MLIMESLSSYLEDRRLMFLDDIELPVDVLAMNKNLLKDLNSKITCDFDKDLLGPDRETLDSIDFMDTAFPYRMRKSLVDNPCLGQLSDVTDNSSDKVPSTLMFNMDLFKQDIGFGSELSATAFDPDNQKESFMDLKLERSNDSTEVNNLLMSKDNLVYSLVEDSLPVKRARTTNLCSQIPLCQVEGCYKDLSSSKDYHKRHRVCDVHSKTAKVIINGIEKRFCQQCSRFHLLSEFDNGKRSCRKRLAGHNQRRRKPQLSTHLGSRLFEMSLLKNASFLSSETLSGFYDREKYIHDHSRHIKLEKVPFDISQLDVPMQNGHSPHKSLEHLDSIAEQNSSKTCINGAISVELSMLPDSCCALSLLSAKTPNLSSNSEGMSMAVPSVSREHQYGYFGIDQKSAKKLGTSSSKSFAPDYHFSIGMGDQDGIPMAFDGGTTVCFEVQGDELLQISDCVNSKCSLSPEVGPTVDLLQLSSHLQKVEQQRTSLQLKQEDDNF